MLTLKRRDVAWTKRAAGDATGSEWSSREQANAIDLDATGGGE